MTAERAWTVEGFHHVQLAMPVGGEDAADRFYGGALGFEIVPKPAHLAARGGRWFRSGTTELHLGVEDGFEPSAKAHPAVRVRGLQALRDALATAGVGVVDDTQLDGHDRWYVRDPFGNRLEFIEEVAGSMEVPFQRLESDALLPEAAHPGDAGLDLRAAVDVTVAPGARVMIPTGVAVAIPDGHAGLVLPRSGLASKQGLTLANAPGLIDAGYRGEVIVAAVNLDRTDAVSIARGDRIAQLVIIALPSVDPTWVTELPGSQRGVGGFGSTGSS